MSSKEDVELKAGHPPAVKAGGKRVARTHHSSGGEPAPKPDDPEQQEYADPVPKDEGAAVLVSGAVVKGDQAFPPEAVKHYHEKPVPSKVNRQPGHSPHQQVNQHINQPR